ncbi:uncharacterized protein LOC126791410 [Argentina anserina]|uniref:uncharacterized protein LOC126791410 n=1 Tax=Argentina anserina TaxID=57926 RepID=UPI002176654D|nr:uncharacterized protein LOC126791410 [Potentilla anserina]
MILSSNENSNPITILIPTQFHPSLSTPPPKSPSFFFLLFLLILLPPSLTQASSPAMKVHPIPKRRNISIQYHPRNPLSEAEALLGLTHKKLRRLPHVFSRVLELPFRSDADVLIEETPDCFRFVAETETVFGHDVRAHTVEIHPGVTKIVVRESGDAAELTLDELELDMWRFRLPESTRPELARAVFVDGELVVTVPKMEGVENEGGDGNGGFGGGMGNRLVLVQ